MRKDALDHFISIVEDPLIEDSIFTLSSEEQDNIPNPPTFNYVTYEGDQVTYQGDNVYYGEL